jgi:hypothetical protein
VIIASTIGLSIVLTIAGLAWRNRSISEFGGEALIAIGSALVGSLATYMGTKS